MFFHFNQWFDVHSDQEFNQEFNLDKEIDSLAMAIKIRTLVVPLGQRFPAVLQNFIDKEEKYRAKLKSIFIYRSKKYDHSQANAWLQKFFSFRWQLLQQFYF